MSILELNLMKIYWNLLMIIFCFFLFIMKYFMRWNYYGKLLSMVLCLCFMDIKLIKKGIGIECIYLYIFVLMIVKVISEIL